MNLSGLSNASVPEVLDEWCGARAAGPERTPCTLRGSSSNPMGSITGQVIGLCRLGL